jgi:type I restriction-modification system DNA methylase subunit
MTSTQQRAALQRQIWQIANDVRGAVDGWDFKQYVLGTLFYRFISENFASYIEGGDDSINYAVLSDKVITPEIKDDAIKKHFDAHIIEDGFFGQELNHTTYNLSVSSYVEAKDNREVVDIAQLNAELKVTVAKIDRLRTDIDAIVAQIEGIDSEGASA